MGGGILFLPEKPRNYQCYRWDLSILLAIALDVIYTIADIVSILITDSIDGIDSDR